jgi:hypothetical protein
MDLNILGLISSLGYKRYIFTSNFIRSTISFIPVTVSIKEEDSCIYTFLNEKGDIFYMWSVIFNKLTSNLSSNNQEFEDTINFKSYNFFINEDSFLIPECDDIKDIFFYFSGNTFQRPSIPFDTRQNLGDKIFIISNAGILFSYYENGKNVLNPMGIDGNNVKWERQRTLIGSFNSTFEITVNHLLPRDLSFWE